VGQAKGLGKIANSQMEEGMKVSTSPENGGSSSDRTQSSTFVIKKSPRQLWVDRKEGEKSQKSNGGRERWKKSPLELNLIDHRSKHEGHLTRAMQTEGD